MDLKEHKVLMFEAAVMYFEKKLTQQEIAKLMNLSRQTVSKLINEAVKEKIVEIIIHNPKNDCEQLQLELCEKFGIKNCIVTGVSCDENALRESMTVKIASDYIMDIIKKGNVKIALSWGRTVQKLIDNLHLSNAKGNVVFPLFGATDSQRSYFSSNELARGMADKIGADVKYAWFPYMTDSNKECELLKELSYYKNVQKLWNSADIAILGIGNTEILDVFRRNFGQSENHVNVIGDISTHFFDDKGQFVDLYKNTLCASVENLKNAGEIIAIACGDNKVSAILGALRTNIIDTLITDEYTARKILKV